VIDTLLNLLFRCSHRRLTRPLAPITKAGQPQSQSYVVCLDCGKQFEYDLKEMRMGKLIDHSHDACVVPKPTSLPTTAKVKYALLAAVPAAIVLGVVLKAKKQTATPEGGKADPGAR
jgi:DNA-directed RNA polymerase subunit RPC12/RpoP